MSDHHYGGGHHQGKGYGGGSMSGNVPPYGYPSMHCNMSRVYMDLSDDERKCLEERKYWCFLLSRYNFCHFYLYYYINKQTFLIKSGINHMVGVYILKVKMIKSKNGYCKFDSCLLILSFLFCFWLLNDKTLFEKLEKEKDFSIVTFCVSMLLVVVWRIITHLCCQRERDIGPPAPDVEIGRENMYIKFTAHYNEIFGANSLWGPSIKEKLLKLLIYHENKILCLSVMWIWMLK